MAEPPKDHPNASLYCDLMEQIKWRTKALKDTFAVLHMGKHYLALRPTAEFCLLQLRFICELIAVGCVAIHTDVQTSKALQKLWNADAIMGAFDKLKPDFFPVAAKDVIRSNGDIEIVHPDAPLSKAEFRRMYNFFGKMLHAGTFKTFAQPNPQTHSLDRVESFLESIILLLNCHVYRLYDKKKLIRVIMNNVTDGRVWLNEFEMVE